MQYVWVGAVCRIYFNWPCLQIYGSLSVLRIIVHTKPGAQHPCSQILGVHNKGLACVMGYIEPCFPFQPNLTDSILKSLLKCNFWRRIQTDQGTVGQSNSFRLSFSGLSFPDYRAQALLHSSNGAMLPPLLPHFYSHRASAGFFSPDTEGIGDWYIVW